jgi:transposase
MTHQAVADHFDVSRITISRLMIHLRQTGRKNDRPYNGRLHVTSEQDVIVYFVRINAFHTNIGVNDNKQLFWF